MKTPIFTFDNKKSGDIELSDDIYGVEVRGDILARVVNYQLAKARSGTHKVKGRSEISRTTKKFVRQKVLAAHVTAHAGSIFSVVVALFMAPRRAITAISCRRKVRALGLKTALAAKVAEKAA